MNKRTYTARFIFEVDFDAEYKEEAIQQAKQYASDWNWGNLHMFIKYFDIGEGREVEEEE